jgi:hypothetical protein
MEEGLVEKKPIGLLIGTNQDPSGPTEASLKVVNPYPLTY